MPRRAPTSRDDNRPAVSKEDRGVRNWLKQRDRNVGVLADLRTNVFPTLVTFVGIGMNGRKADPTTGTLRVGL